MFNATRVACNISDRANLVKWANESYGRTLCTKPEIQKLFDRLGRVPKYGVWTKPVRNLEGKYELNAPDSMVDGSHDFYQKDGSLPVFVPSIVPNEPEHHGGVVAHDMVKVSYVPERDPYFVPTEYFRKIEKIVKSGLFFPAYVVGLARMGKTMSIIEAAARNDRELVRVNFTEETSERHLIGGWRIADGNTVWEDGPVLVSMKRGAILVLDEVDFGTSKILCLQSILEGSPYINKQTGEIVRPARGFTIFATANTKGQVAGRSAKFVGAKNQNEAFLDRFDITIEQDYPNANIEAKILAGAFTNVFQRAPDAREMGLIATMTKWSEAIRDSFNTGAGNDVLSTGRLKSLVKAWAVFGNLGVAVNDTLSRFDPEIRKAWTSLFNQLSTEQIDFGKVVVEDLDD